MQSPSGALPLLAPAGMAAALPPPGVSAIAGLSVGVMPPTAEQTQAYYEQAAANTLGLAGRPIMGGVMEYVWYSCVLH